MPITMDNAASATLQQNKTKPTRPGSGLSLSVLGMCSIKSFDFILYFVWINFEVFFFWSYQRAYRVCWNEIRVYLLYIGLMCLCLWYVELISILAVSPLYAMLSAGQVISIFILFFFLRSVCCFTCRQRRRKWFPLHFNCHCFRMPVNFLLREASHMCIFAERTAIGRSKECFRAPCAHHIHIFPFIHSVVYSVVVWWDIWDMFSFCSYTFLWIAIPVECTMRFALMKGHTKKTKQKQEGKKLKQMCLAAEWPLLHTNTAAQRKN